MKYTGKWIIAAVLISFCTTAFSQTKKTADASMGKVKVEFSIDDAGTPSYTVLYNQKPVVLPSKLGFILSDNNFSSNFELTGSETKAVDNSWKPVLGEVSQIRDHYNQLTVHLKERSGDRRLLDIVFKVFEEGVGFRYEFPKQPKLNYFIVKDEVTEINMSGDHKAFWIPGDFDSNEYIYTTSKISEIDNRSMVNSATEIAVRYAPDQYSVATPLMLKTADGLYINIHEAAGIDYPAMQLHVDKANFKMSARLVPDAVGNKAYLRAPFNTPWRTIIVSDKAADILASKMILNLNEPSKIENTSWIKPMKFVGVWWEMQTGKGSWTYADKIDSLKNGQLIPHNHHSANTANVKRYIDFAAANGIGGVLVEGWNTGWEEWFGLWKENVFDFVTPYPDFDVKGLQNYAKSKNVAIIMHNETSGSATNYERQLDTAFRFMNKFGYPAVKTGYVGKIIPRGEHHDGQWMVSHYLRTVQKAATHKVMIDIHESVRPTGLHRTYPNWLANEAGRGNEFNAFHDGGNPPEHETILPFTRLMGGPMDYTPGIFKLKGYAGHAPNRQLHTTLAKQLALYVTLYSPLQMAADFPENYDAHKDAFQFIRDVPVDWDDSKIIEAEPGDFITIARKEKAKPNWFIGAITDENKRIATVPLTFLDKGKKYVAVIYGDGPTSDCKTNPEAYMISSFIVDSTMILKLNLAPGGGSAVSIMPSTPEQEKKIKKYR
ncbi:MAG: glycoside hydrolase family 97 protein [Cyclobacteriaceae bacterium]|nr:glycoside hydrolase family 97 protein [Cyclobacteriaceae bacterium]